MTADKRGLILEGGAMRGMFTCGVIDVCMENGIVFDGAVGVSAGAAFGINYKSKQIGRPIRYNMKYMRDKRYCSFRNLIKTGDMFDAKFCYETLPFELDIFDVEALKNNPMEFYVTATDVCSGQPRYHLCEDGGEKDLLWIRASASIPMLSKPVEVDGFKLLDGGISDSIPVKFLESKGYNKNVVVLTRPLGYRRPQGQFVSLARKRLKEYPAMITALELRADMYNGELDYISDREAEGELFVIRPPKDLKMPNMAKNPKVLKAMYDCGRDIMTEKLPELVKYLEV